MGERAVDETLRKLATVPGHEDFVWDKPSLARELLEARATLTTALAVVEAARTLLTEALAVGKRGGRGRPPSADALLVALAAHDKATEGETP